MDTTSLLILIGVGAALFFLLSPGILLTIPANQGCQMFLQLLGANNSSMACSTSLAAVGVHTLVWALVFGLFTWWYLKDYVKTDPETARKIKKVRGY